MKRIYIFVVLLFITATYCYGEKIDGAIVEETTLEINPSIKSAKNALQNAQSAYYRSLGAILPDIGLSANASQSDNDALGKFTNDTPTNYSYSANASFSIFNGFGDYYQIKQSANDLSSAKVSYDRAVSDALYKAAEEYINLMWAYERVELLERIKNKRAENRDMVKLKYNSGNVDLGSLRRVEADVETANADLRRAKRYIETVTAALFAAMGKDSDDILETNERIPIENKTLERPVFRELIKTIPEFLTAYYNYESAKAQKGGARSGFFPSISLSGSINQNNPEKPQADDPINSWNAGLTVSYAFFTGGRDYFNTKIAARNFSSAQENFRKTEIALKASAIARFNNLIDAYEDIKLRELYLQASRLQSEISDRKYVNGLSTYQDWYSIENDHINSQIQFLEAKRQAVLTEAEWVNFNGEKNFIFRKTK